MTAKQTPAQRASVMRTVLGYSDEDAGRVRRSMKQLEGRIGNLVMLVKQQLLDEAAETAWFGEDPDTAKAFATELSDYVMKVSAGDFSEAACDYVAGLSKRLAVRPPPTALIAAAGVVGQWLAKELPSLMEDDPFELAPTLVAWQKLLTIHLDLMLVDAS